MRVRVGKSLPLPQPSLAIAFAATYASSGASTTKITQSGAMTSAPTSRIVQRFAPQPEVLSDTLCVTKLTSVPENEPPRLAPPGNGLVSYTTLLPWPATTVSGAAHRL